MNIRLVTAAVVAATWVEASASVAALAVLALTPSAAAAQDNGLVDPAGLQRIEKANDLERGLRQAEAARLRGDCARVESFTGMFFGMHMNILPAEVVADFQRRWREISARPCPPESAAPPPPQARPEEVPPPQTNDAPPVEDIPTYEAEPAPPGYGGKTPTIGVPYRDPTDPMIFPLPPPEKMETDPPPPKKASGGAPQQEEECDEASSDGQCETEAGGTPKREKRPPR